MAGNFAAVPDNRAMNAEIAAKLPEIEELCRRFGVTRLELFGSATGPEFDAETSDFDFLVEFEDVSPSSNYGIRFLDFAEALEAVLGRSVDLLTPDSIRNPYLRQAIDESRVVVLNAQRQTAAL
jgi:predicted nucleotidyltransferase